MSLSLDILPAADDGRLPVVSGLGGAWLGLPSVGRAGLPPLQRIAAQVFGEDSPIMMEAWRGEGPVEVGEGDGVVWARQGGTLFGVIEIAEESVARSADQTPLQAAGHEAYRRLFGLLGAQGVPHLWRVWNFMAGINLDSHGLERYRQFNQGRQGAFLEASRAVRGAVPAASALGLMGGPLSVAFLAGGEPVQAIENPRQVSAYDYPADYGPSSPTFSRAGLVRLDGRAVLFISGTASIVGHATLHPGDVVRQCQESLDNIEALLAATTETCADVALTLGDLIYRVYVRRAEDYPQVRDEVRRRVGGEATVIFLQADICRADLLLEIEAVGFRESGKDEK